MVEPDEDTIVQVEDVDEETACNQRKLFVEHEQAVSLIHELCTTTFPEPTSDVDVEFERKQALVCTILDRYLEQSNLLDPHLRELLTPLLTSLEDIIVHHAQERSLLQQELQMTLQEEEEEHIPRALAFPCQIYHHPRMHALFQVVYHLCKVRGYKTILKLFPHAVDALEPTLVMLQSQDRMDHRTWTTRYVLLLWISMFCLVPFDLSTIDSTDSGSIVFNLVTLCKQYLSDSGPTQLAGAVCLARLLSRPDMEAKYLHPFLTWANTELCMATTILSSTETTVTWRTQQFLVTGIMRCLSYLAKHAPREQHRVSSQLYFQTVLDLITSLTEEENSIQSSTLHRKLSVKLVQRLGLLYLPPRVQSWRYQRGVRSLELNLQPNRITSTKVLEETELDHSDPFETLEHVDHLEQIVDVLLTGLRDRDTVVRWSAAKGVGRLTARLPFTYADDVVQSVLELFMAREGEGAWHGASLALAELARRGVLLPQRLEEAVDCVARALQYDIRRGAHSIGAHVRDAACYACWSFARAYEPSLFLVHLEKILAPAMLINCVFDRELNCRRAASAAFQECVGRQGRKGFPHGIALLTQADYISVANLKNAFLHVSPFIAQYPEYRYGLLQHLLDHKLGHWDTSIRVLASMACGRIAVLDSSYAQHSLLPRLLTTALSTDVTVMNRHGAILAIAEVVQALIQSPVFIDGAIQQHIKGLSVEVEKKRLFRGRGGEMIRVAVCYVMQIVSIAAWPLKATVIKQYIGMLEECLVHGVESVREAAIDTFRVFISEYAPKLVRSTSMQGYMTALISRYIDNGVLQGPGLNPNVAARRGFLRALGVIPLVLLQNTERASNCLRVMIRAAMMDEQTKEEWDAESRVAAIRAMVDFCSRPPVMALLGDDMAIQCLETLLHCIQTDYSVDERGDVGSWVRKEAMTALEQLLLGGSQKQWVNTLTESQIYGSGRIIRVVERATNPNTRETSTEGDEDVICHVQFNKSAFGFSYFAPLGIGLVRSSSIQIATESQSKPFMLPPLAERVFSCSSESSSSRMVGFHQRIPPSLTGKMMNAFVKQLAEKLDSIRTVAGATFFRLLHSSEPRIDGIPDRFQLEQQILPSTLTINWSVAHDTFPLVIRMMEIPAYTESIVAGLVISVGGLTESVVKASKSALLEWFHRHLAAKDHGLLSRVAYYLITVLQRHHHEDRVTIPLLKTIAFLLEEGLLSFLFCRHDDANGDKEKEQAADFGERLYGALKNELARAAAVPKLAAGIAVLIGLLPSDPSTESKTLRALILFLAHRFPKVRKLTAETLYTRLLVYEHVVDEDKYDTVIQVLSSTAWDGALPVVRTARDQLLQLMNMDLPQKKAPLETNRTDTEENTTESYQTLVQEMGY